jgi:hypothetical protein
MRFADDFEDQQLDASIHDQQASAEGLWQGQGEAARKDRWAVTNDTSFGKGVQSLLARGDGRLFSKANQSLVYDSNAIITVDLDLFIRSNSDFPFIIPNSTTRSDQRVTIGIERSSDGTTLAATRAGDRKWALWNESGLTDTQASIAYDAWNHLQIAINPIGKTFRVVVQPIGEVPIFVGSGTLNSDVRFDEELRFFIETSDTGSLVSAYDNICVTTNPAPQPAQR